LRSSSASHGLPHRKRPRATGMLLHTYRVTPLGL
jgi:hypothetical protein